MKKTLVSVLIFIIMLAIGGFLNYSNAAITIDGMIDQGDSFISTGKSQEDIQTINGKKFNKVVKQVFRVLFTIGVAVSVVIIAIMGVKIMLGSAEEKAQIKEQMVPYVIGCGVMFGAFTIWKIAMLIAGNIS